jgi:hypothetical protein
MEKTDILYASWDPCEMIDYEAEARKDDWEERYPDSLDEDGNPCCPDDDYIRQDVNEDCDFWEWQWDDIVEDMTNLIEEINPGGLWTATGEDIGWQNLSGSMPRFEAKDGKTLLNKVLPNCDKHYWIYRRKQGEVETLVIKCSHHDSPMGEMYYLVPWDDTEKKLEKIRELVESGELFNAIECEPIPEEVHDAPGV